MVGEGGKGKGWIRWCLVAGFGWGRWGAGEDEEGKGDAEDDVLSVFGQGMVGGVWLVSR